MNKPRHFLSLLDLNKNELLNVVTHAIELKRLRNEGQEHTPLKNKVLAMIFEKASTRTRVSFEAGMTQLGGSAIFLSPNDTQIGRGEPVSDTARVISSMVDAVMLRTFKHETVEQFAEHSSVPVINGLTDYNHPCQLLADIQAYMEAKGSMEGTRVTWIGDGNNMCHSYINAARMLNFELAVACPQGYEPLESLVTENKDRVEITSDPLVAAKGANLIVTDVWASMGDENEATQRENDFANFQVNEAVMSEAKSDAIFLHCLPAHRGEEVSAGVIDGPQSHVWNEAENRLHAQKSLLEFLVNN